MTFKKITIIFLLMVALELATPSPVKTTKSHIDKIGSNDDISVCGTCCDFVGLVFDVFKYEFITIDMFGNCMAICFLVRTKIVNSTEVEIFCDTLCNAVGIEAFLHILNTGDVDTIYYCEQLEACKVFNDGDAKITQLSVSPNQAKQGNLTFDIDYISKNGTGTGEISINIHTVDNVPFVKTFLNLPKKPGNFSGNFLIKTEPDPLCDKVLVECEEWLPGFYTVIVSICNGKCDSKHPNHQIYDIAFTNFTIIG